LFKVRCKKRINKKAAWPLFYIVKYSDANTKRDRKNTDTAPKIFLSFTNLIPKLAHLIKQIPQTRMITNEINILFIPFSDCKTGFSNIKVYLYFKCAVFIFFFPVIRIKVIII